MHEIHSYVDGSFAPGSEERFATINPATGKVLANVSASNVIQIEAAVSAARRAASAWRATSANERAEWLLAIADELERSSDLIAGLETDDTGLLLSLTTGGHLPRAVQSFRYFATLTAETEAALAMDDAYVTWVRREPLGVVAVIAPWNAPLAVAALNTAAALATGNCVILKPSERSPLTADALAQIAHGIGFPAGVFQVLQGDGAVGRRLAEADGIDGICFVGGVDAGIDVVRRGASTLKRVTLELGGKSPTIIFADCDFDAAVDGALLSAFSSNGEVCAAGSRILVEASLYDHFLEAFAARASAIRVGDPRSPASEMGPLIDERHLARVEAMVADALKAGAVAVTQFGRLSGAAGSYFRPAVLDCVTPDMRVAREEVFGPVTAVIPFRDEAEAVAIANFTDFGLHASIWSKDVPRALCLAGKIEAGSVAINAGLVRDIRAPFGGRKLSGLGRLGGSWSLDAFSEPKSIALAMVPYELPRLGSEIPDHEVTEPTDC